MLTGKRSPSRVIRTLSKPVVTCPSTVRASNLNTSSFLSGGMLFANFPRTSSFFQPKIRSAEGFQEVNCP